MPDTEGNSPLVVPTEETAPSADRVRRGLRLLKENSQYVVSVLASIILTVALLFLPINYEALGNYGYLSVFLLTLLPSATVIFPSPTLAAAYIAGTFLNPLLVGLLAGLGATLGELTGYMAGYGGSVLAARSRHYERIRALVDRFGLLVVFIFALIPNPLFDLTGIAAGTMRLPLWQFQMVCFLGKSIRFILIAYLGQYLPWPWLFGLGGGKR